MSHYSDNPNSCKVDFFKTSGKWYTDEAVIFDSKDYDTVLIHDAFKNTLKKSVGKHFIGMQAVCLEPYHQHSHPISIIWEG